jgi:hypothetical protein
MEGITIRHMKKDEWSKYKEIFTKIFGEWAPNQFPQIVVFAEDDKEIVAFTSFTRIHVNTVYLQYFGTNPDCREIRNHTIFEDIFEFIQDGHIEYVAMRVDGGNTEALIAGLNHGFSIVGFVSGYVEMIREIKHG